MSDRCSGSELVCLCVHACVCGCVWVSVCLCVSLGIYGGGKVYLFCQMFLASMMHFVLLLKNESCHIKHYTIPHSTGFLA